MDVDIDPNSIWVPPHSRAAIEQRFSDSHFGKFYRIEQVSFFLQV
jgi:Niemann-Pick C1 protein